MESIIGREAEIRALTEIAGSGRPEFVAVYGRRRVGKTFLVRSAFKDKFVFYATGIIEGTYEQELEAFNIGLERYGWKGEKATNWMQAFKMLAELLKSKCSRRTTSLQGRSAQEAHARYSVAPFRSGHNREVLPFAQRQMGPSFHSPGIHCAGRYSVLSESA